MSSDYANRHLNIAYLLFETDFQGPDPKCLCNIVAFDATLGNMEHQGVWQLLTKHWHHLRTELSFCDGGFVRGVGISECHASFRQEVVHEVQSPEVIRNSHHSKTR